MPAPLEHMGVDHSRAEILVTQKLLDCADIITGFEQVRGKAVPKRVRSSRFGYPCGPHCPPDRLLDRSGAGVVTPGHAGPGVHRAARGGEYVLPAPLLTRVRVFAGQREGQIDFAKPFDHIALVELLDPHEVVAKRKLNGLGKHRHPIFLALAVAHGDRPVGEIDVLHPQPHALGDTKARAVKEPGNEGERALQPPEHGGHLLPGEHHRKQLWALSPGHVFELSHGFFECVFEEEQHATKRLVLGRSSDLAFHGEMRQKSRYVFRPENPRISVPVKAQKPLGPTQIRFLGANAVVERPNGVTHAVECSLGFHGDSPPGLESASRKSGVQGLKPNEMVCVGYA